MLGTVHDRLRAVTDAWQSLEAIRTARATSGFGPNLLQAGGLQPVLKLNDGLHWLFRLSPYGGWPLQPK